MSDAEPISREEAKERIDDAVFGFVVVAAMDPVPTLGTVDPEELRMKTEIETFRFGSSEFSDD